MLIKGFADTLAVKKLTQKGVKSKNKILTLCGFATNVKELHNRKQ